MKFHKEIMSCFWGLALSASAMCGYTIGMALGGEAPVLVPILFAVQAAIGVKLLTDEREQAA